MEPARSLVECTHLGRQGKRKPSNPLTDASYDTPVPRSLAEDGESRLFLHLPSYPPCPRRAGLVTAAGHSRRAVPVARGRPPYMAGAAANRRSTAAPGGRMHTAHV